MKIMFDYVYDKAKGTLICGNLLEFEGEEVDYTEQELEVGSEFDISSHNLELSLIAFSNCCDIILDYGLDDIEIQNQNAIIFKWLGNLKQYEKRPILVEIKEKLQELLENGTECKYEVIPSNKNKAKKRLKANHKIRQKGNFSEILGIFPVDY